MVVLLLLLLLLILLLSVIIQDEESLQGRLAQRKWAVSSDEKKKKHLDYLNSVQGSAYIWMNSFESNHYKSL